MSLIFESASSQDTASIKGGTKGDRSDGFSCSTLVVVLFCVQYSKEKLLLVSGLGFLVFHRSGRCGTRKGGAGASTAF